MIFMTSYNKNDVLILELLAMATVVSQHVQYPLFWICQEFYF